MLKKGLENNSRKPRDLVGKQALSDSLKRFKLLFLRVRKMKLLMMKMMMMQ
jgi:hypothetical protein